MYIPLNKIITNLYTSGNEYVTVSDKKDYVGFYFKTYEGRFYTGKTPNDTPVVELIKESSTMDSIWNLTFDEEVFTQYADNYDGEVVPGQYQNLIDTTVYNKLKKTNISQTKLVPQQSFPFPTEMDYNLGSFTRYFTVKTNEESYLEINKDTFTNLFNQNPTWGWIPYTIFKLTWTLTGNEEEVEKSNYNITLIRESNLKRAGLQQFLRFNYLKFYQSNLEL